MHSFFKEVTDIYDNNIIINDSDYHHIANVLRLKKNTNINIVIEEEVFLCNIKVKVLH